MKGIKHSVLDDGFVYLVDVMGDDSSIVQAARVSYGEGTKTVNDDRGLIRYLMRHRHSTPFEMVELKFHVRVPMDTWRQWVRHRTANINEYSTRYSEAIDSQQKTMSNEWRLQKKDNKQGSEGFVDPFIGTELSLQEEELHEKLRHVYEQRLAVGVAREQARKDLPLSTYTEAYWKIDLHNLLHFLALRMDSHAQYEIRQYAITIGEKIVKPLLPLTWEAFEDYRLHAMHLTRLEVQALRQILSDIIPSKPWPDLLQHITNKRENSEALQKLLKLGSKQHDFQ
jgi:thymidylate synthase (FAD)